MFLPSPLQGTKNSIDGIVYYEVTYQDLNDQEVDLLIALLLSEKDPIDLNLSASILPPHSLKKIGAIKNLIGLDLSSCELTDNQLKKICKPLAANFNFKKIILDFNSITSEGAKFLLSIKSLELISLSQNLICDKGAAILARHSSLKDLDLSSNQLTDAGVQILYQKLSHLRLDVILNQITSCGNDFLQKNHNTELENQFIKKVYTLFFGLSDSSSVLYRFPSILLESIIILMAQQEIKWRSSQSIFRLTRLLEENVKVKVEKPNEKWHLTKVITLGKPPISYEIFRSRGLSGPSFFAQKESSQKQVCRSIKKVPRLHCELF